MSRSSADGNALGVHLFHEQQLSEGRPQSDGPAVQLQSEGAVRRLVAHAGVRTRNEVVLAQVRERRQVQLHLLGDELQADPVAGLRLRQGDEVASWRVSTGDGVAMGQVVG